jgi:hypothetical protein
MYHYQDEIKMTNFKQFYVYRLTFLKLNLTFIWVSDDESLLCGVETDIGFVVIGDSTKLDFHFSNILI